jgi:hypothetical protein
MRKNELKIAMDARKKGWKVYRNGWPDLLLYDNKTKMALAVEIKGYADKLSKQQILMRSRLNGMGIKYIVIYSDINNRKSPQGKRRFGAIPNLLK